MRPSILVVDDDADVRSVLMRKMELCGYDVREAGNGREAIAALQEGHFDLVITDIIMPEADGIETISYLRKAKSDVKVIVISAPGNRLFLESAVGLGAARSFSKPLVLADLAAAVEELLAS